LVQTSKLAAKKSQHNALTQSAIDNAFSKPYRRTQSVGVLNDKNIVILTPKYSNKIGVINDFIPKSSINRALVEMIIHVEYFRNSQEIIQTYLPLKTKININEVYKIVAALDLIYPYFQCVGFYLQKIGFTLEELIQFKQQVKNLKFYTDKNQDRYLFDDYWQMYYMATT